MDCLRNLLSFHISSFSSSFLQVRAKSGVLIICWIGSGSLEELFVIFRYLDSDENKIYFPRIKIHCYEYSKNTHRNACAKITRSFAPALLTK